MNNLMNKKLFILIISLVISTKVNSQTWTSVTAIDGEVSAMIEFNGKLYVGGNGVNPFGNIIPNFIMKYNGLNWDTVGSRMSAIVSCLKYIMESYMPEEVLICQAIYMQV